MPSLTRLLITCVFVLGFAARAHADAISDLIPKLEADAKNVRLATAVALAKKDDPRIILPFVKVLGNDSDAAVRAVAAAGLGKLVHSDTKDMLKNLAVGTLKAASSSDSDSNVRTQAAASLAAITGAKPSTPTNNVTPTSSGGGGGGGFYVNVGPMSAKTGDAEDTKWRDMMVKTTGKTLTKNEPTYLQTWPGGPPTRKALDAKKVAGYYVDGTLNELKVTVSGANSTISCKVSMLLASFPEKSVFGFLNGGAKVQASASASDQALAKGDCVEAVTADLIATKIIPTMKSKAGPP